MTQIKTATILKVYKSETGYWAKNSLGIYTQAETLDELYKNCVEACESHFGESVYILWEFEL